MKRSPVGCAPRMIAFLLVPAAALTAVAAQLAPPPETPPKPAAPAKEAPKAATEKPAKTETALKPIELSKDLKKLGPNLHIDQKNKWVVIDGIVVLREGPPLEMFACLKNTKEHESIVSVDVKALHVHGALLAVGAKQGTPVQFQPEYKPATGAEIEVRILWTDDKGKARQDRAQNWVRDMKTKKAMAHPFVFAGSMFWTDEETKERFYMAEGGELICVSNFSAALLDVPVASSQSTAALEFEAFTENVPPEGTKVQLVLMPKRDAEKKDAPAAPKPAARSAAK